MNGYYDDPTKLTFDEAHELVREYLDEYAGRRNRVTSKDVATEFSIEQTHHNLIRLNSALDERLEIERRSGAKATQYRIEQP